ncbi:MAG: type II/IV secretion system ATPase subunit [Methanocalculus sp.]|nr:type II/IV secretion system ATPase subunit [Methanocalculus sp.]MDO9539903.1 type II/IV secretion system ATPase subunit [Methanocalculus sp.]
MKVPEYDFDTNGSLVHAVLLENEEEVDSYWIEKGLSLVTITYNKKTRLKEYHLSEPVLTQFEYELLERVYEDLRDILILTDTEIRERPQLLLFRKTEDLLSQYGLKLEPETMYKLRYYLKRNFLGWSRIDPLMKDLDIEDISCDGHDIPLFLYHRKHRNIRTNIQFPEQQLNSLAISLAQRSGKHISIGSPILDATLPEGSRLQLTLGTEVTTRGSSFTIRKFRPEPFTPIELMEKGTFSVDQLVYFWLAIENNKSLLYIGGTASGKTSSLNAMSLFIPPLAKVVSIEDTREIMLYRENWIASVTRESITAEGSRSINMFDLLKAAMRQRPEFIIVGEVRGPEAQTLFQAMNTGHTTYSTMHAGGVDATIHRLESEPLNVPRNMLQALNIISVQGMIFKGSERVRRCQEIVEITGIEPNSGNVLVNNVFEYDPVTDEMRYSGRSHVYSAIAANRGWSREEISAEVERRRRVILALHEQEIRDFRSVSEIFSIFAITPDVIFNNIDDLKQVLK